MPTLSDAQHEYLHQHLWAQRCRQRLMDWQSALMAGIDPGPVPQDSGRMAVFENYLNERRAARITGETNQ